MFVVISKWEFDSSQEKPARESASRMMAEIRSWDGVESAYNVEAGENHVIAVIAYHDRAAYDRLINDPESPFEKAAAAHRIEDHARWVWSERGEVAAT